MADFDWDQVIADLAANERTITVNRVNGPPVVMTGTRDLSRIPANCHMGLREVLPTHLLFFRTDIEEWAAFPKKRIASIV